MLIQIIELFNPDVANSFDTVSLLIISLWTNIVPSRFFFIGTHFPQKI